MLSEQRGNLHTTCPTKVPTDRRPAHRFRIIELFDSILAVRKLDFLVFDDQINAADAARDLSAVGAVADVASALGAEEVVVGDFDFDS